MPETKGERFVLNLRELSGALGDLGTLLPLMLGTIAVARLAPTPVFLGFAAFYVATALYYRLPIPVQPMKAVVAVLLTAEITAAGLAASGIMIGVALLVLGLTGWITRLARVVPQSVLAGLQLGLGLALALVSLDLMATAPVIAVVTLGLLLGLLLAPRCPSALIALAAVAPVGAQSNRNVKVVLEFKQQTQGSRQGVQGQGGVIVQERSGSWSLSGPRHTSQSPAKAYGSPSGRWMKYGCFFPFFGSAAFFCHS